jgi:hypothetical protein
MQFEGRGLSAGLALVSAAGLALILVFCERFALVFLCMPEGCSCIRFALCVFV